MNETRVGTRALKARLSEYMRRVKAGETITVTEHGKTIGKIIPVRAMIEERTQAMVAAGQAFKDTVYFWGKQVQVIQR